MSCSRTQHGGGRFRTPDLSLRSPTLYHWATALPYRQMCKPIRSPCCSIRDATWGKQVKSGNRTFRPRILLVEDYPYSVKVTTQLPLNTRHMWGNQVKGHFRQYQHCMRITLIPSMLPPRQNIIIMWKHRYIRMFPHLQPRLIVVAFLQNVDTSLYRDVSAF